MGIFRQAYKFGRRIGKGLKKLFGRRRKAPVRPARRVGRQTGHLTVKKTIIDARIPVYNSTNSFGVDTFELTDVPEYTNYIALYEQYRIDKIVYSFKALNNTSQILASNAVSTLGMIHTNIDYTDGLAPTSIQNMMNDSSYKGSRSSRNHTRTFRPAFLNDVGGLTADQSKRGWLNTTSVDGSTTSAVSHYGIKWCFEGGLNTSTGVGTVTSFYIEPIITYYVSFKDPK